MSRISSKSESWNAIFNYLGISDFDFSKSPYYLTANDIKDAVRAANLKGTAKLEPRIICKMDTREERPEIFAEKGLFLLPVKNGAYAIVQGEGYMDIPEPETLVKYTSKLPFQLKTSFVGNSEMQHLDYAYATSLVRTFCNDEQLVLTIRGRKYTPEFDFRVGKARITTKSVQTEVDAGYESDQKIVLVEAKNSSSKNTIIRQLFYPYRQWKTQVPDKEVVCLFYEKRNARHCFWEYVFDDDDDYNSIRLNKASCFEF